MVERVDDRLAGPQDRLQARAGFDPDGMHRVTAQIPALQRIRGTMLQRAGQVMLDVLHQAASGGHVHDLVPAADRQERHAQLEDLADAIQLEIVEFAIHVLVELVAMVKLRVQVVPAGDEQGIHSGQLLLEGAATRVDRHGVGPHAHEGAAQLLEVDVPVLEEVVLAENSDGAASPTPPQAPVPAALQLLGADGCFHKAGNAPRAGESPAVLYPETAPFNSGKLEVGDGHALAYLEYGNPGGIPVVYLHGGPGAGTAPYYARYFDPAAFRIVTYDQRGAPLSKPAAYFADGNPLHLIESNSPDHLVEDNEKLRQHLCIDSWHVFGGSWGATLALLYAERYPAPTLSLTLRGVFLMRALEIDWYLHHTGMFYPEVHREFVEFLPPEERSDLLEAYYKRLIDPDPEVHFPAAFSWTRYENGFSYFELPPDSIRNDPPEKALPFALIEAAFFRNHPIDDRILENLEPIRNIPTHIVQGRHDCCCPPTSAYDLSCALSRCSLEFTQAGHSGALPENIRGLVHAANRIRDTGTPVLAEVSPPAAP